jgi:hypothetical protein
VVLFGSQTQSLTQAVYRSAAEIFLAGRRLQVYLLVVNPVPVMKILACLSAGILGFALNITNAADSPRGNLLELHSCELYAGGCVVSSEAPQGGRYMLRVWEFSGGNFNGTELKGLQLAALQVSPDNLAMADSKPGDAVVYLPESASPAQRDALLAWIKSSQKDFHSADIHTRTVPMQFTRTENGYAFSAGDFVSVNVGAQNCETSCGEELWYKPRTSTSLFTVAVNRTSKVHEELLSLNWTDDAKRSVFLARFGEPTSAKDVYVTMNDLCGPARQAF